VTRVLARLCRLAVRPGLEPGARYVCDVAAADGRPAVLRFEHDATWTSPAVMAAEAFVGVGQDVLLRDEEGRAYLVPRSDVLWPAADHALIRAATLRLGLPLVPRRRFPQPRWRLGRTWVDVGSLTALSRTLDRE
jgi:hypothetical protein